MNFTSYGKYHKYNSRRSTDQHVFYELREESASYWKIRKSLVFEPTQLTFKKEEVRISRGSVHIEHVKFRDVLVLPLQYDIKSQVVIESNIKRLFCSDFVFWMKAFAEDLYLYDYFKEVANIDQVKRALNAIPLINGIVLKYVYEGFKAKMEEYSRLDEETKKIDIRTHFKRRYEDAYLNWSYFLQNSENERLFIDNGWFRKVDVRFQKGDHIKSDPHDLDEELYQVEKEFDFYLKKELKLGSKLGSIPVNVRTILGRHGITDLLSIAFSSKMSIVFKGLLSLLIFSILLDILHFNLFPNKGLNPILLHIYKGSVIVFSIFTILVGICLYRKWGLQIIPAIFLPRLTIAILSGWILFLSAEELLKIDIDIQGMSVALIFICVLVLAFAFVLFEINGIAGSMRFSRIMQRSAVIISLSFIISYSFGFWTMTHINRKFLSIDNPIVSEAVVIKKNAEKSKRIEEHWGLIKNSLNDNYTYETDLIKYIDTMGSFVKFRISKIHDHKKTPLLNKIRSDIAEIEKNFSEVPYLIESDSMCQKDIVKGLKEVLLYFENKGESDWAEYDDKIEEANRGIRGTIINWRNSMPIDVMSSSMDLFTNTLKDNTYVMINGKKVQCRTYYLGIAGFTGGNIVTFPNVIFIRSLFAMFFGIFLQLLFQDKSISEPL